MHTNTVDNPWTLFKSDDKKRARLNCMRYYLTHLDYPDKDYEVIGKPDPKVICNPPPIDDQVAAAC